MTDPIRLTRLPNGLTVVSETMPRVETVSLGAYVCAGTRDEAPEENGVSHFLEHMAFKGTARRDAMAISAEIESVGGHLNAYTAREQTAYYAKVLKEDAALAADIIGDILTHSVFDAAECERERGVILQEIGQANDTPDDIVFDHFQAAAFPDQPMGRPTLGTEETVRAIGRDTLRGYLHRHYAPGRMVVAAAGAIEHEALLDLVARHFRDLPEGDATPPEPARYQGGEYREEQDLDQVHIVLGFEGVSYTDPLHYPVLLLSTLLGGGMSSRLFQEIRERRGLVYAISAFATPFQDSGLFQIYAGTGETEAAQLRASLLMSLESTGSRCEALARQVFVHGRVIPVEETKARIAAVTLDDIAAAARRIFARPPTLAVMGPHKNVPPVGVLAEALAA
jgi:predicted Zn-dependent peptidase